jgi:hypothetical protein
MAGKNTAVFGIYTDRSSVDRAVEAGIRGDFPNPAFCDGETDRLGWVFHFASTPR